MADESYFVDQPWNAPNLVPMRDWLCKERSEEQSARLRMMGNIVVPAQAFTAISILKRLLSLGAA